MRRGIGRLRAGGSGIDTDAAAWAAAVTANSGTYSAAGLAATDAFCKSAKASGYWSKLNRINLFAGGGGTATQNLAGTLVPLKVGGGSATETNVNFVAGDYTEATGLTGNGSTKYLTTGLVPSVSLTLNDTHVAIYNRGSGAAGGGYIGAWSDATPTNALSLLAPFTDGNLYSDAYNAVAGRVSAAVANPYGLLIGSRTASNLHTIYKAGSSIGSNATNAGALPAIECYVFAHNRAGVANPISSNPLAAYSIGSGLTAGDVTAYNTHMQAFQTALSRNV